MIKEAKVRGKIIPVVEEKRVVNVLGTEYSIETVKISECELLKENGWCGSCNSETHKILIGDPTEEEYYGKLSAEEQCTVTKKTLRHEIIHAFLNESGLQECANQSLRAWSLNEEMIDWIAIQFPKMQKAFEEVGCL